MAKKLKRQLLQEDLPFHLNAQAPIYLPICDDNPYAAYLLTYCFEQKIISEYKYAQKQAQEEADLAALTEEERGQELINRVDEGYDRYLDRLLNEYNGEAWLNDEDDAVEGRDGYSIWMMLKRSFCKGHALAPRCRQTCKSEAL